MSGHSKWSQIKRTKGILDKKRGAIFSKLAKQISIAAREGGNPDMNFKLRLAIQKAKEQAMPNENIDRAIKKAAGTGSEQIQSFVYEGYGPHGTAFLVEVASDNPNKAYQNTRNLFTKNGGSISTPGTVAWMFQTKGQILVERDANLDQLEMAAIDAGADDVRESEEGLEVYTKTEDLEKVKNALADAGAKIAQAEIIKESSQGTDLTDEEKVMVQQLFEALNDDEDVVEVHTSANL